MNMKLYSPRNVSGGTIDGAVIGGTTPAAGTFTTGEFASVKITTGAGAGKIATSDADGDLTWESAGNGDIKADGTVPFTADIDGGGNYAVDLQNFPDLLSGGPGYWFDGVNDKISLGTDTNLNLGTGDGSFIVDFNNTGNDGVSNVLFDVYDAGTTDGTDLIIIASGLVRGTINSGGTSAAAASTTDIGADSKNHVVGFTIDRDSATGLNIYLDGLLENTADPTSATAEIASTGIKYLGVASIDGASTPFAGNISRFQFFNLALSAAEVKAFSNGAAIPYSLLGASQTEKMPNQVDRDFSGASAWADVDLAAGSGAYDETGDLTITAGAAGSGDYCTLAVLSAPTTIGKRYRMTYDYTVAVAGAWTIKDFTGVQTIGTVSATATQASIEWTATTPGGFRIVAAANDVSGTFDNFTLTQIGCVLNLEPSGIGHKQWIDNSGNNLTGEISGAIATNLPANHREKYIDLLVTGNTSFTLPQGYKITSIIVHNTTANALTGGLDCGLTTDGVEIVSAEAIGANAEVVCTLIQSGTIGGTFTTADDTIYFSDGDDDTNWNSASLEITVSMERISL